MAGRRARRPRRLVGAGSRAAGGRPRRTRARSGARTRGGRRARAHDRPRPGRVRRRRPGRPRRGRPLAALRPDLVRHRRHGPRAPDSGRRRPAARGARPGIRGRLGPRRGAPRDALHRPDPRRACGADHLRVEARRLGVRARPRPRPSAPGARRDAGREALGSRRDVLRDRSRARADRLRAPRSRAGAGLDASRAAGPSRGAPFHAGPGRVLARTLRARDPAPRPHRGARGPGAVRLGPEGVVGDAAQAQPDRRRADLRARPSRPGGGQ